MVPSTFDEIFIKDKLEFEDSLKDLKNLRKQLYSAAEYFESSYNEEDDHQQSVLGSSKEYVAKALVNTIDHLGCVADKLNSFLDGKTNEFLATNTRLSCIQQKLSTFQGVVDLKGVSQQTSLMVEAPKHHKQYIVPQTLQIGKSKTTCAHFIPCPQSETQKPKQENNPFAKDFQSGVINPPLSFLRKTGPSRVSLFETTPRPGNFSFTRLMSHREPRGKRSGSPLPFSLKRSESVANYRPASPIPPELKQRSPSVPRGAMMVRYKPETGSSEREAEPKTKRSKHQLLKALLDAHWARK